MRRKALDLLKEWKDSPARKPLLLRGARQVGKTWLLKEFGKDSYENLVYFNFDEDEDLKTIFESSKNSNRIIDRSTCRYVTGMLVPIALPVPDGDTKNFHL